VPPPGTGKNAQEKEQFETIHRELKDLSERQGKVSRILLTLAESKKERD
jgi:hypothetical protein